MAGRQAPLKAALMDQRLIAGLGNIYVCEALWRARLSPDRKAGTLATKTGKPTAAAERLATAIRDVLNDAIAAGGSSLRDHIRATGELGEFQHAFAVYDREGEPCPRGKGHHPPQGPFGPLDLLLSGLPALRGATMAYECITTETRDGAAVIRLNRPQALNALNAHLIAELGHALDAFEADDQDRRHRHHRLGEGLRRRRRHQGDGGAHPYRGLSHEPCRGAGARGAHAASR